MKQRLSIVILGMLLMGSFSLSAQLFIGPGVQLGMTYAKNFVIEDTSQYYISNSPGLFAAAGVDLAYQFDEKVRLQLGVQGQLRAFNLREPEHGEGVSFTSIKKNAFLVSLPLSINYRIPMGDGGNRFFNIIAGHSFDFSFADSTVIKSPMTPIDSGGAFIHHVYEIPKQNFPLTSVLLGIGMDMKTAKGNLLNVSLVWGISTRTLFKGSVQEWRVLHQNYDPATALADPEEFPDNYFEWALRGSNVSVRAAYYFDLKKDEEKKKKEEADEDDEEKADKPAKSKPAKADKDEEEDEEKPAKAPKAGKEPKPSKEKAPKKKKSDDEEDEE
jgi:hypothetical protein